jgi:hypothetical protein
MKRSLILALALVSVGVFAESNPIKNDNYKWHDAQLTDGTVAVVKGDWHVNDAIKANKKLTELKPGRMFVERVIVDKRRAIRFFEVHGWPVCPIDGTTCMVLVGKVRYRSSSNINYEKGEIFKGVAVADKFGNGYITNNDMVDLLWNNIAFTLNTKAFANYTGGNPALFSERANENFTQLNPDSNVGFDRMGDGHWTGIMQSSTDSIWSNIKRSAKIREDREYQPLTSQPRVVIIQH